MRRMVVKPIVGFLAVLACQQITAAKADVAARKTTRLERAVAFAVYLEAHANRLESRTDVCVGFGHGLAVDDKGILFELRRRNLKVHSNNWCNQGPRGFVIEILGRAMESAPDTYEVVIELGDLRPIREAGEHFGTLLRRGTYTVKCQEGSEPELLRYEEAVLDP